MKKVQTSSLYGKMKKSKRAGSLSMPGPVGFPTRPGGPDPRKSSIRIPRGRRRGLAAAVSASVAGRSADERLYSNMGGPFTKKEIKQTDKDYDQFLKLRLKGVKRNIGKGESHGEKDDAGE